MVKFIEKLKKVFSKKELVKTNKKESSFVDRIIPNIRFGDVVLSKNVGDGFENWEKDVLVVIGKKVNELLCYYCETVSKHDMANVLKDYRLFKNGKKIDAPFSLRKIDEKSFERVISKLSSNDLLQLKKRLKFHFNNHKHAFNHSDFQLLFNPIIKIRDIVKMDDKYYLVINSVVKTDRYSLKISDVNLSLLPIINYKDINIDIDCVKYNQITRVNPKECKIEYVDTVSKDIYSEIVKYYYQFEFRKNELLKAKDNNILKRGYIINFNDKYYYVYDISEGKALAFEIVISDDEKSIKAGNTMFTAHFDNKTIIDIKNDKYEFFDVAYFNETTYVEEAMFDYFSSEKESTISECKCAFKLGDVLEHELYSDFRLIVVGVYANKLITINFESFIDNGKIEYNEFMFNDSGLRLSDNVSPKELSIIKDNLDVLNSLYRNVSVKKKTLNNKE